MISQRELKDKMVKEDEFLIDILQLYIQGQKLTELPEISVENLLESAEKQNVAGIVSYMVAPLLNTADNGAVLQKLKDRYIVTVYQSTIKDAEAALLAEKLEQAQIPYAFFKGMEIRTLYPDPELRTMGDVDLFVEESNMEKTASIFQELGYERHPESNGVWAFYKGIMAFEVHMKLVDDKFWNDVDYTAYFEKMTRRLQSTGSGYRRYFSIEDHFLFLCFHLAKHLNSSGAGIRMFMDIAVYLMTYQNEMDWEYIRNESGKLELTIFIDILLSICREWFGISLTVPFHPADTVTLEQLKEYVMSGGIFGFSREESIRRLRSGIGDAPDSNSLFIQIRALWKLIFPSRKIMAYYMPAVKEYPLFLPAAWIKRWKIGFENKWKMRAVMHGFGRNVEEAKAQYSLLKRIGL